MLLLRKNKYPSAPHDSHVRPHLSCSLPKKPNPIFHWSRYRKKSLDMTHMILSVPILVSVHCSSVDKNYNSKAWWLFVYARWPKILKLVSQKIVGGWKECWHCSLNFFFLASMIRIAKYHISKLSVILKQQSQSRPHSEKLWNCKNKSADALRRIWTYWLGEQQIFLYISWLNQLGFDHWELMYLGR